MNKELILLADRLERMERLDPALGEEAKAALLALVPSTGLDANPLLDFTACNSLAGVLFGAVDVLVWYRLGRDGGPFLVTLRLDAGAVSSASGASLCAAFLAAMCRAAAEPQGAPG